MTQSTATGRRYAPCYVCGRPTSVAAAKASPATKHDGCFEHGRQSTYSKRGCRCLECTDANRVSMLAYSQRRRDAGRSLAVARKRSQAVCVRCGEPFMGRSSNPGKVCSFACRSAVANAAMGWEPRDIPKFTVPRHVRLWIYEAAAWRCCVCSDHMKRHYRYDDPQSPTLDHVTPRALGGSDDPMNLRACCAWCNTTRGAGRYTDDEIRSLRTARLA